MKLSDLDYIILYILSEEEISGYTLRKKIGDSLFFNYSSSPGSIYPAMKKLLKNEFIEKLGNSKKVAYSTTRKGGAVLNLWLKSTVAIPDIQNGYSTVLLKFKLMENRLSKADISKFLGSLEMSLASEIERFQSYHTKHSGSLSKHQRNIFEYKIETYYTLINWCEDVKKELNYELQPA